MSKRLNFACFVLSIFLHAHFVHAGLMEISASYGVRTSSIDEENFTESETWSGSFAWYFLEMSAIELSYTQGNGEQSLRAAGDPNALVYFTEFEMYGADLVITFAEKKSVIQPFIRGGAARLKKKFFREDTSNGQITEFGEPVDDVVPSYGFGLKIMLTQGFSIKGSYDRWRSGSTEDKDIWDDAIKGGISWMF